MTWTRYAKNHLNITNLNFWTIFVLFQVWPLLCKSESAALGSRYMSEGQVDDAQFTWIGCISLKFSTLNRLLPELSIFMLLFLRCYSKSYYLQAFDSLRFQVSSIFCPTYTAISLAPMLHLFISFLWQNFSLLLRSYDIGLQQEPEPGANRWN